MNLDKVKQNTTWNDASGSINSNFEKIRQAILAMRSEGVELDEAQLEAYLISHGYTKQEWVLAQNKILEEKIDKIEQEGSGAKAIELQQEWVDGQEHSIGMTWEEYTATPYVVFTFPSQNGANLRFERVALCDRTANFTDIYVETQIGSSETAIVAEVFKSGKDAVIKFIDDIKALPRFLPTTDNADSKFLNAEGKWVEVQTDVDHPVFEFTFDTTTNKATAEMVAGLASAITAEKLILCNGRTYKFILEQDGMYGLVSDAYMDIMDGKLKTSVLAVMASSYDVQLMEEEVPTGTEITESTISGWGFTKNVGTITGIKMNGATKGTSGVVDLGNVLTEHQKLKTINGESIVGDGNIEIQGGGATPRVEMTAASAAIEPNKFYVWPMMDSLDLTLGAEQTGVMNRYLFQFRNPKAGLTMLTLPDTITWSEDTELDENGLPVMEAAAFYRIEIIEGLASLKKWKLVYIQFADAEVERVLMSKGVGDGIGITKRDAAAVTDISIWFQANSNITSFHELRYFTGLTSLPSHSPSQYNAAFYNCANLESITIPANVEEVGNYAFAQDAKLREVNFVDSTKVKYILAHAFGQCSALEGDYQFPNLIEIGWAAFSSTKIGNIHLGNLTVISSGYNQGAFQQSSVQSVSHNGMLKEVQQYAFDRCANLKSIDLSSVEKIGYFAFNECTSLESVDLNMVKELDSAFQRTTNLAIIIDMPNLINKTIDGAFTYSGITGVRSIGLADLGGRWNNGVFQNCKSLQFAVLGTGVTKISWYDFEGCSALQTLVCEAVTPPSLDTPLPSSLTAIYVPDASVEAYKAALNWNAAAAKIKGISEQTETL